MLGHGSARPILIEVPAVAELGFGRGHAILASQRDAILLN
jgi:hypothetical protein